MMYRQGDVLVVPVDAAVAGDPLSREEGRIVLAHGEATGHAHAIAEPTAALFAIPESADRHLRLVRPSMLLHEEHAPIELPAGTYRVRRQREYHPEEIRTVAD